MESSGSPKKSHNNTLGESQSSWNTIDINEELIDNNNATSKWLIASIIINFMLDIAQLSIYIAC
jgi:hypothetical protein